jgi:hypothetical protein
VITVLPQRILEIRVKGLSVEDDPDRTTIREVATTTPPSHRCSPNASCSSTPTADRSPRWSTRASATLNPLCRNGTYWPE